MILENGVVRTMEPTLPVARALAIAGDRIAGGVGTHETALPSPERVDLGGRCVVPGFTDSHVHFPTWAVARTQVRLEDARSLDEAVARVAEAARSLPPGRWLRGFGWRSGAWSPPVEPTKEALDAAVGELPVALMAKDYHSLWLSSAGLAAANGDLERPGGVVERDERGEPTGVLREECAWHFRDAYLLPSDDEHARPRARADLDRPDRAPLPRAAEQQRARRRRYEQGGDEGQERGCAVEQGLDSPG